MLMGRKGFRKRYLYPGLVLLAAALGGFGWSYWPLPARVQTLTLTPTQLQTLFTGIPLPAFLLQANRRLVVSYPGVLRQGDTGHLTLHWDLPAAGAGSPGEANVLVEARLDMLGILQNPAGSIDAPLAPDQALVVQWQITGVQAGRYRGTLWSYLNPTPTASRADAFTLVAAQDVELQIISLGGLDLSTVKTLSAAGLAGSVGLILYAWLRKPKKTRKKRPRSAGRAG